MLYKRPNFRMGGSPTGIETLTPRVNARTGFGGATQNPFNINLGGGQSKIGTRTLSARQNIPTGGLKGGDLGSRILAKARGIPGIGKAMRPLFGGIPTATSFKPMMMTGGAGLFGSAALGGIGIGQLLDFYAKSTKTPEEYKRLKEMGGANFNFDETNLDVGDVLKYIDKGGDIGEAPGFFPRGGKKKLFKDKGLDEEGLPIKDKKTDDIDDFYTEGKIAKILPGESALDAVLREGKVIAEKRAQDEKAFKSKDTKISGETVEDSFEADFNRMQKRITKFLKDNKQETKGKVAIALSNAVGTPGSLADKAAVLNNALLGIASAKKKDEKDIAKLAFAAATELEGKRIDADKLTTREKTINEYTFLKNKGNLTKEEETRLEALEGVLRVDDGRLTPSGGVTYATAIGNIKSRLRQFNDETISAEDKIRIRDDIKAVISGLNQAGFGDETILDELSDYPFAKQFFNKGGRVNMAIGGATETPAEPVATNLTFEQLRTRLPKEITDDIVQLVATSEEALQDFAYIRTQGDVEKFNVKYGVNLVLPQNTV